MRKLVRKILSYEESTLKKIGIFYVTFIFNGLCVVPLCSILSGEGVPLILNVTIAIILIVICIVITKIYIDKEPDEED